MSGRDPDTRNSKARPAPVHELSGSGGHLGSGRLAGWPGRSLGERAEFAAWRNTNITYWYAASAPVNPSAQLPRKGRPGVTQQLHLLG